MSVNIVSNSEGNQKASSFYHYISYAPVFFHRCCFRLIPVGDIEIHQSFSLSLPDTIDSSFAGFLARSSPHLYRSNEHHRQTPLIASPPVSRAFTSQVRLACDRRLPTSKTPIPMKLNKNRSWSHGLTTKDMYISLIKIFGSGFYLYARFHQVASDKPYTAAKLELLSSLSNRIRRIAWNRLNVSLVRWFQDCNWGHGYTYGWNIITYEELDMFRYLVGLINQ
ncbi:hypothetical protein LXL04_032558 [Taraxacum kok-saghyz]